MTLKLFLVFSLVLVVLITSVTQMSTQKVNAIKKGEEVVSYIKTSATTLFICNNSFCYKNIAQEEVEKSSKVQNQSAQMITNTDAHNQIISAIKEAETQKGLYEQTHKQQQHGPWKVMTGSLHSVPEIHTELSPTNPPKHEIGIILPDSGSRKVYDGVIAYSASTDVAAATLVVPVNISEMKGQLAAAMDGKTLYAITTQDHEQKIGTWQFAGNVLTLHNHKPIPFSANYTVAYREVELSKNDEVGTVQSSPSALLGNNNEQVVMILPPTTEKTNLLQYCHIPHLKMYS